MIHTLEQEDEQERLTNLSAITGKIETMAAELYPENYLDVTAKIMELMSGEMLLKDMTLQGVFKKFSPKLPGIMKKIISGSEFGATILASEAMQIKRFDARSAASLKREKNKIIKVMEFAMSQQVDDPGAAQLLGAMLMYRDNATSSDYTSLTVEKALASATDAKSMVLKERLIKLKASLPVKFNELASGFGKQLTHFKAVLKKCNTFVNTTRNISSIFELTPQDLPFTGTKQTDDVDNINKLLNLDNIADVNNYIRPYILPAMKIKRPLASSADLRNFLRMMDETVDDPMKDFTTELFAILNKGFPGQSTLTTYLMENVVLMIYDSEARSLLDAFRQAIASTLQRGAWKDPISTLRDAIIHAATMIPNNDFNVPGGFTNYTKVTMLPKLVTISLGSGVNVYRASETETVVPTYLPRFKMHGVDEVGLQIAKGLVRSTESNLKLAQQIIDVANTHYYGSEFTGWIKRLNSLYETKFTNQTRKSYINSPYLDEDYQVDAVLNYFTYLGRGDFSEILSRIQDKDPSRWDEALAQREDFTDDLESVPEAYRGSARFDKDSGIYYVLIPEFEYNRVNLKSGAGFPYDSNKKKDCIRDVANRSAELWRAINNNATHSNIMMRFPELNMMQPKPKKEVYSLGAPIGDTNDNLYYRISATSKTRSIFNISFLAGFASQKLFSLASNTQPIFSQPYLVDGQVRFSKMEKPLFSIHGFSPVGGNIDLLLRRVQNMTPFTTNVMDYTAFGYSDNGYVAGCLNAEYEIDKASTQFVSTGLQEAHSSGSNKLILPVGTRVLVSLDGKRMESSTTRALATRVMVGYLLTLGITAENEETSTLFKYIMFTLLTASSSPVGVIGQTQFEIPFNTSGNPLTFTYNDVLVFMILNEYTKSIEANTEEFKIDIEKILQLAHQFGVTLTVERITILEPSGSFFSSEIGREIEIDLLGFSVTPIEHVSIMFSPEEDPDLLLMVPVLERARMIKQFLFTKTSEVANEEADTSLRCLRYLSLLFAGGIRSAFWGQATIPYLLDNPDFITYLAPSVSSDNSESDNSLLATFNEVYSISRSELRLLLDKYSEELSQIVAEALGPDAEAQLRRRYSGLLQILIDVKVKKLYSYHTDLVEPITQFEATVSKKIALKFEADSIGISKYEFADKTFGTLAPMLDKQAQNFLRLYKIDGEFKLSGSNLVSKIVFDQQSILKMESYFQTFIGKIKGEHPERQLPFFKDRVRKMIILEPSLLENGYKSYRSLMVELNKEKVRRQMEQDKLNEARRDLVSQNRATANQAMKKFNDARKAENRQKLLDTTKFMTLSEINASVKPVRGLSRFQNIKKLVKEASASKKLSTFDIDAIKSMTLLPEQQKQTAQVAVNLIVTKSMSIGLFSPSLQAIDLSLLQATLKSTKGLTQKFKAAQKKAINNVIQAIGKENNHTLSNLIHIIPEYFKWCDRVQTKQLIRKHIDGHLHTTVKPILTEFEATVPIIVSMKETYDILSIQQHDRISDFEAFDVDANNLFLLLEMIPPIRYSVFTDLSVVDDGTTSHLDGRAGPSIQNTFNSLEDAILLNPGVGRDYTFTIQKSNEEDDSLDLDIGYLFNYSSAKSFQSTLSYLGVANENFDVEEFNSKSGNKPFISTLAHCIWSSYAEELIKINCFEVPVQFCSSTTDVRTYHKTAVRSEIANVYSIDPLSLFLLLNPNN